MGQGGEGLGRGRRVEGSGRGEGGRGGWPGWEGWGFEWGEGGGFGWVEGDGVGYVEGEAVGLRVVRGSWAGEGELGREGGGCHPFLGNARYSASYI